MTSLAKWLSVRLQIKWMLVWFSLQSLNLPLLYCCKETRNFFGADFLFVFGVLSVPPCEYKKFCKIAARKFWNIRNILKRALFHLSSSESDFLKYRMVIRVSVSWDIRKAFFWKNKINFFGILVSWSIRTFLGIPFP